MPLYMFPILPTVSTGNSITYPSFDNSRSAAIILGFLEVDNCARVFHCKLTWSRRYILPLQHRLGTSPIFRTRLVTLRTKNYLPATCSASCNNCMTKFL